MDLRLRLPRHRRRKLDPTHPRLWLLAEVQICGDFSCIWAAYNIQNTYSDSEVIWIEEGRQFLRYLQNEDKFNALRYREFFPDEDEDSLQSLIGNMRNMSHKWKESLDEDGSLRFYID